ncbi:substrate-binding domain-containing protein [Pseudonocardia charpentierae]|uniref:Substrate-binding domain-containing protein n=1 Tax=Pseudonocardia charpentierae TaxID=3075545 RepID=A0ABU2NDD7_9PSEU|nr:substrate-binding domain-containing protein [Pseudonocardia sp. DSM 45834]MDT0351874.1 substrate-binding domain-containing protein [Pseudonocardia sp. DSM 45834]
MKIDRSRRSLRALAVVAAASAALAACSSQGGAPASSGGSAPAAGGNGTKYTIAMITHEQAGDTFWDKIRAGAQDAATEHGIDLKYSNNENGPEQATLVQNAIDSKVNGIAVTLSSADAVVPVAKKAAEAGIPVVAFNQGIDQYQDAGAKMYFGSDEALAGQTVGEKLAAADPGGKTLCIIQAQGSVALETRCQGVKAGYANTENLQVNGADLPSVQQTIQSKLAQDSSITNIVTLGAPIALAALQAEEAAGKTAKLATFDLNQETAQAIKDGKIQFSVDQQPYVQGYMAVTSLWLNLSNGNDIGGGKPTLTGPSIVDSTNIDQILPYTANNRR